MGSGIWSTSVYDTATRTRAATGKSVFDYGDSLRKSGRSLVVHPDLDPKGVLMRESRDSEEHPNATPIAVIFDVTGSMLSIPAQLQAKLPELLGLLLRKGYVSDPQILFGGVGDATCDRVPLQIGQFESDNRMDECLSKLILEGGGGGQMTESYELAMYFLARHTALDSLEKRGKKGYLFMIGDETAYSRIKRHEVGDHIGDGLEADIPLEDLVAELKQKFEVFFLVPAAASHGGDSQVLGFWRKLFGQNVLELDDVAAVCETIALTIGLSEGTIDLEKGVSDLKELSVIGRTIKGVSKTLAPLAAAAGSVATASAPLPGLADAGASGAYRL